MDLLPVGCINLERIIKFPTIRSILDAIASCAFKHLKENPREKESLPSSVQLSPVAKSTANQIVVYPLFYPVVQISLFCHYCFLCGWGYSLSLLEQLINIK